MCWSGPASATIAVIGFGMTASLIRSGEKKELWLFLLYFSLMELLQATNYIYVNQCSLFSNKILTFLGFAHAAFQPVVLNMAAMHFIPERVRVRIAPCVYTICCIGTVLFLLKAYPFAFTRLCAVGEEILCGMNACTYRGNWHIAWQLPLNNILSQPLVVLGTAFMYGLHTKVYIFNAFILPCLYGSWPFVVFTLLAGPLLAYLSTDNINEFPTIWCLYSLEIMLVIIKSPLRKYFYVQNWFFYDRFLPVSQSEKISQPDPVIIDPITSIPIHSKTLPLHEFQLMYWLAGFSEPVFKTLNVVGRKRFQGWVNKTVLDAAMQLVLQKQEIFSYHIHRFYPLQTLCTKPSMIHRASESSFLQHLPDGIVEAYLNRKYRHSYYKKIWQVNRPWIAMHLYYLNHNQVEIQVCMSHLIADERSVEIFFQELSNAYLFFTHQTASYTLNSFQSYQHYIYHQNILAQQNAQTDEIFWADYLRDAGLLEIPKQYISPHKESITTPLPLAKSLLLKLKKFCIQQEVDLNNFLCAAVSLTLLECCYPNKTYFPGKLCISAIKSARDSQHYKHTMGCFLRMEALKLDLFNQTDLLNLAKQAQQSADETVVHQRAPALIKLASIGKLPQVKKPLRQLAVQTGLAIMTKYFPECQVNPGIIKASKEMVAVNPKNQFLICVDIAEHFLPEASRSAPHASSFGLQKQELPTYNLPMHAFNHVIHIIFRRDPDQNMPFFAISGNLTPEFKALFKKTLIAMIGSCIRGG